MLTNFCRESSKNWHTPPSCNGWENRNTDGYINTSNDHATSDKKLVNFGPVLTPEFTVRVCAQKRQSNAVDILRPNHQVAAPIGLNPKAGRGRTWRRHAPS